MAGWVLGAWVLAGCAAGWSGPRRGQWVVHVDARALPGGDGSPERPFQSLAEAVAVPAAGEVEFQVASGDYPGAWALRPGQRVVGRGAVLVHADSGCVVRAAGGGLENVLVQGGEVGLCVEGEVQLRGVTFSGQREAALRVVAAGALLAGSVQLEATVPDILGMEVLPGARARLDEARFDGPFRRAVSAQGAELEVSRTAFHDARTAVQAVGGHARLRELYARGGHGPAIYLGQARAEVEGVKTEGHEFGLLVGAGSRVTVRGLEGHGAERAGMAFDHAVGELEDVVVWDAGNLGALQLTDSRVSLSRADLKGASFAGVQVVGGEAMLRQVRVRHVQRESGDGGDGLVLHRARVALEEVSVEGAEGSALVAGSGAQVEVGTFKASFVQHAGVFASGGASVSIRSLQESGLGEVAIAAVEGAQVRVQSLDAKDAAATAWADCPAGSRVCVEAAGDGASAGISPGPCVQVGTRDKPAVCR